MKFLRGLNGSQPEKNECTSYAHLHKNLQGTEHLIHELIMKGLVFFFPSVNLQLAFPVFEESATSYVGL